MRRRWPRPALWTVLGLYVVGLGVLGGVAVQRIRDDQARQAQVKREADAARRAREQAMDVERRVLGEQPRAMPWMRPGP